MSINKLEGRELDARVAEKVMGWTQKSKFAWEEKGVSDHIWLPLFSTDIAAAWTIHQTACKWVFSERKAYLKYLQDAVSQRVMPLDYVDLQSRVSWPDVLVFLKPEDFCRAALMVAKAE